MKTRLVIRRAAILPLQLFGLVTVVFILIQLLPGDPRYLLAGPLATDQQLANLTVQLGLDQPIYVRYFRYVASLAQGDLGYSWYTGTPVTEELARRFPATLELVLAAFALILITAIPLGIASAISRHPVISKGVFGYGMVAGSLPDFWWGLMMILIFFVALGWAPAPIGRLDLLVSPPERITGLYTVDSALTGNWAALGSSLGHLVLPASTLAFVYGGQIVKMTRTKVAQAMGSGTIRYAKASGWSDGQVQRSALRIGLLPVMTLSSLTLGYLIGGAVLIETVFSWGGLGQYAVQAIVSSDYFAVTGAVLATATFALIVYLVLDVLTLVADPRIRS